MAFGAVACSACRRVQAVDLRFAAVRCRACGKAMTLAERKVLARSEDEAEVARAVALLAARHAGAPIEALTEALAASEKGSRPVGVDGLLETLASLGGEFSRQAFVEAARRLGLPGDPERLLEALLRDSLVFEPRPGRYLLVA